MKKLDMNLLERYYAEQKIKAKKGSSARAFTLASVSLIFIAGAFTAKLYLDNSLLQMKLIV